jgi:phosphoglycolate phosphatase-like HAD superfamily hydrolase
MLRVYRPAIDTVLLDVDGTLVDSNDAHAHAWVEALAEAGVTRTFDSVRSLIGMGADQLLPHVSTALAATREPGKTAARREGEIFKQRYLHTIRPMDGARELLLTLKSHGVRCVVATSASNDQVDALLEVAMVGDLIVARATGNDAEQSKPAPDIVHAALLAARSRLVNSVMLGDTRYDIEAAHAAGLPAIALRCGGAPASDLSESAATFDTPHDLAMALQASTLNEIVAGSASRFMNEARAEHGQHNEAG